MLHTNEELIKLAAEFTALRQVSKKRFPKAAWLKAISITHQIPLKDVCQAISVPPTYFRKKMAQLVCLKPEKDMTFIEVIPPKYEPPNFVKVSIEASYGHKLTIEGATVSCLVPLLAEFLK